VKGGKSRVCVGLWRPASCREGGARREETLARSNDMKFKLPGGGGKHELRALLYGRMTIHQIGWEEIGLQDVCSETGTKKSSERFQYFGCCTCLQ
jgi:hypothetical protein